MTEDRPDPRTGCTSCGEDDATDAVAVHRMYVTPPPFGSDPDAEPTVRREDEVEHWCTACRTHYPHTLVEGPAERSTT